MKYDIQINGHAETIDLNKNADGTVIGTIASPEGGAGTVSGSWSEDGCVDGELELAGHHAKFSALIIGDKIKGTIRVKVGPFWVGGPSFAGQEATA